MDPPNRTVKEGDYYYIQLPKEINIVGGGKSATIHKNANQENREIAHYQFEKNEETDNWQIKITFADIVDDPNKRR
ncbi:MAG TPA: Ig-like domain-containing protein [Tissierellaceae bacterium]|nr:Ig-like domain-containing protein [Tissierellaceae bacterium]